MLLVTGGGRWHERQPLLVGGGNGSLRRNWCEATVEALTIGTVGRRQSSGGVDYWLGGRRQQLILVDAADRREVVDRWLSWEVTAIGKRRYDKGHEPTKGRVKGLVNRRGLPLLLFFIYSLIFTATLLPSSLSKSRRYDGQGKGIE
ncbi:hypothetical protein Scep_024567 [Stephania cephalantha]|uniref:Uncharacterized protein n=1 Tax=Stephania cephalantha TaxID=152367 RepID=A0AAP0EZP0_9MAGN